MSVSYEATDYKFLKRMFLDYPAFSCYASKLSGKGRKPLDLALVMVSFFPFSPYRVMAERVWMIFSPSSTG